LSEKGRQIVFGDGLMIHMNTLRFALLCFVMDGVFVDFTKKCFINGEDEKLSGSIIIPTQQHILYVNRLMMNESMKKFLVQI
jgi:hypothetical protein